MAGNATLLSRDEARRFYDAFGAKQDQQGFYEDRATRDLCAHADFAHAQAVVEFGCGTGRFAATVLADTLPRSATYMACDQSPTMVELARGRVASFGARVDVRQTDGSAHIDAADATFDRFVSNYVLDLLPAPDIMTVVAEAHRVLRPGGLLCLVSLTYGTSAISRAIIWLWMQVHQLRPRLVGGCRPLRLGDYLGDTDWETVHRNVIVAFGIPSEVVIARKR